MLSKLIQYFKKTPDTPAIVEGEYLWCITGNIVDHRYHGEEKELKRGTKHFRPGTKVYCIPEFPGTAHDTIRVIGLSRKPKRIISVIIRTKHVKNFRLKKVYSPTEFDRISDSEIYRVNNVRRLMYGDLEKLIPYLNGLTQEIEN